MTIKVVVEDTGNSVNSGEYVCVQKWILERERKELKRVKELIHEMLPNFKTLLRKRGDEIEDELEGLEIPF